MANLSLEDYMKHKSFVRVENQEHFYRVVMRSDETIEGHYMALDNRIVPEPTYEVLIKKPAPISTAL